MTLPQWDGEQNWGGGRGAGVLGQFNRTVKEDKIIIIEYTKQVMQSAIACDPLTNAQPTPKQQLQPPSQLPPVYI